MIIILIISKHILYNVVQLIRIFIQNIDQCILYLLFLEQLVTIMIELWEDLQHALTNEMSEPIVRKTEFVCRCSWDVSYSVWLGWHFKIERRFILGNKIYWEIKQSQ